MPHLKNIIPSLLTPLLWLNFGGMALGALWLVAVGQWQVLWLGVLMVLFSPYIIPILMMPAGIFSHFMALYQKAGQAGKERRMFVCSIGYIVLFLTVWCAGMSVYVTGAVKQEFLLAGLLWSGSVAMAPLLMWSSRDRGNVFILTMVETAQAAVVVLGVARVFLAAEVFFWAAYAIFGALMAGAALAQAFYEKKQALKPR